MGARDVFRFRDELVSHNNTASSEEGGRYLYDDSFDPMNPMNPLRNELPQNDLHKAHSKIVNTLTNNETYNSNSTGTISVISKELHGIVEFFNIFKIFDSYYFMICFFFLFVVQPWVLFIFICVLGLLLCVLLVFVLKKVFTMLKISTPIDDLKLSLLSNKFMKEVTLCFLFVSVNYICVYSSKKLKLQLLRINLEVPYKPEILYIKKANQVK